MGVQVFSTHPGDGRTFPRAGNCVKINYTGTLLDGKKFDSSHDRGNGPFLTQIGVGKVIRGWDEGICKLSKGEKALLIVTPDYGYGSRGFPPFIPPNATLRFEVELIDVL
ncbi:hypothetical protein AGABI1DRAFT_115441 [Agaricus bisporus var. burnettii JB137-S8]|uniref:peptidylprolyl isomerase n=2 Tax=Agaricus bisporus var. burnettii TaxID=192524 RepID=K5VRA0_AGABU|nr:hypothetical protein AGABI2DRAFT_190122 [Agaricus bisporus var. bisporus H97]XP_007332298.1 uncharacterized protein AGABI1DRAFT_115441 [Agaricus bisporus var. burnettii JB137-S8]EKM76994.1 hypothetical protein AGABI1DRAFT_115441 [Agaricus bisporus var. burnettii JB137-S8]EKV51987.1 hypothetical protein AGABI2DRAFT_190122 [Agaricus bisporus var. bisporus H97]KAF7784858.1 hypothetical protein Agabi119p4_1023 [Agaricus bisporus var. burnettii]